MRILTCVFSFVYWDHVSCLLNVLRGRTRRWEYGLRNQFIDERKKELKTSESERFN